MAAASMPHSRSSATCSSVTSRRRRAAPPSRSDSRKRRGERVRMAPPSRVHSPKRPSPPGTPSTEAKAASSSARSATGRTSKSHWAWFEQIADALLAQVRARSRCVGRTVSFWPGRLEEQHHHVVGRRIGFAGLVRPALVPIAERGLVTVMAVGDGDRPAARRHRAARPTRSLSGPFSGTAQRRWRTPSSSITSASAGPAAMAARASTDSPPGSSNRPTTGLVLTPVARRSL